jgi:hypothetical protein
VQKKFFLPLLFLFLILAVLPLVQASTIVYSGTQVLTAGSFIVPPGTLIGVKLTLNASMNALNYNLSSAWAYVQAAGSLPINVRAVLFVGDGELIDYSAETSVSAASNWTQFNMFCHNYTLVDSEYYLMLISDSSMKIYLTVPYASEPTYYFWYSSMNHENLVDMDVIYDLGVNINMRPALFAILTDGSGSAPAPSAAPIGSNVLLERIVNLILPSACVLVPAFIGFCLARGLGFFIGINVGVFVGYAVLGTYYFSYWLIFLLIICDAILLYGKIGMEKGD